MDAFVKSLRFFDIRYAKGARIICSNFPIISITKDFTLYLSVQIIPLNLSEVPSAF